ncbi:cation:proton antiporter [Gordonia sp. (in: high G+C Gram-positive bacteria)]|uniref:cation:proton antiporter n=1 Tax=Gordonia sp. (in: high G+C Gram-positive bacteria) TaxID=84139 RepID=UPI0039E2E161
MPDLTDLDVATYIGVVLVLGAACQVLAWRLRVPSILLLLVVGFSLGRLVSADEVLGRDVLFGGVSVAVGVILFEGALSLRFAEARELGRPILRLCTVTVVIAWVLTTVAALIVGIQPGLALLIGALLVVTGPTVIAPILRSLRPAKRVGLLLRWESIVVDPIGAALAVLVFRTLVAGEGRFTVAALVSGLAWTTLIAIAIAIPVGLIVEVGLRRHIVPDHLQGVVALAAAVGVLVAADHFQSDSGLLAVTILGVWLANRPGLHLEHIREFKEHLQVLFVGGLFILLAGRVSPAQLAGVWREALVFVVLLIVVVRPISVFVGLWRTNVTSAERRLLAGMAPRGIVAASVISSFALEFQHAADQEHSQRLKDLAAAAADLVPLVFLVIVATVTVYGLGIGRLAQRLGLASKAPSGVLFVGGSDWVVDVARQLDKLGIPVLVASREWQDLAVARREGVPSVAANILSDYAVRDLDLAGIGQLLACTDDDEVNATAAREFSQVLGRDKVYQLARRSAAPAGSRWAPARHLSAKPMFAPAATFAEIADRVEAGAVVKRTKLSEKFDLAAFRREHGPDAVLMFHVQGDDVRLVTPKTAIPETSGSVIALVPVEAAAPSN